MITGVEPGDVLAVRTGGSAGWWIRFGAALRNKPNLDNHIAVLDHQDQHGTWWAIEGRPGGVGWVDATEYLESPYTITNRNQPKTIVQRDAVCSVVIEMLKVGYDWNAIAQDGMNDLRIPDLWGEKWHGETPGHIVCSSLASWAYDKAHLDQPDVADMAHTQPADWTEFIIENNFQ